MQKKYHFKDLYSTRRENAPDLIYHYTDSKGLFGIVKDKCLWATPLGFLNDSQEFKYAVELTLRILDEWEFADGVSFEQEFVTKSLIPAVKSMSGSDFYVISFSEESDLLSQWRAYGGKGGYSLGFSYESLWTTGAQMDFRLVKCVYDPSIQREYILSLLEHIVDRYKQIPFTDLQEHDDATTYLIAEFQGIFLQLGSVLKHPSFSEEREWRLVGKPIPEFVPSVRPTDSKLVVYYKLNISGPSNLGIKEVKLGPNYEPALAYQATKFFLRSEGVNCVVGKSGSPFRMSI